jgi:uncharacterized protein YbjQ (UPF0145 family)
VLDEDPQLTRIEKGGLPDRALHRLQELRGTSSSFFSVPEYAAGLIAGVEPLGQVVGISACALRRGVIRRTRGSRDRSRTTARWRELTGPVQSWNFARRQAIGRLVDQAKLLDGDAVLGVTVEHREHVLNEVEFIEVTLGGTAVKLASPLPRKEPVVASVSPQAFGRLRDAGIDPVGVAGAFARIAVRPSQATRAALIPWKRSPNQELEDLTIGVYEARRLAMDRLRADANVYGADGVLGVDLSDSLGETKISGEGMVVTVHAFGTAVRARAQRSATRPRPVLRLR